MKHRFIKDHVSEDDRLFNVVGAGSIKLSGSASVVCGGRAGFSLGVSWSEHGIDIGGVLSREEAKKLADRIYEILDSCADTEQECHKNVMESIFRSIGDD